MDTDDLYFPLISKLTLMFAFANSNSHVTWLHNVWFFMCAEFESIFVDDKITFFSHSVRFRVQKLRANF
jgi:hypothetical protein